MFVFSVKDRGIHRSLGQRPGNSCNTSATSAESAIHYGALSRAFSAGLGCNCGPGALPQAILTLRRWR
jgi:hypothetical protein